MWVTLVSPRFDTSPYFVCICVLHVWQSSVYCFYDPDFRALALGKLTALKETEFVRDVSAIVYTTLAIAMRIP